MLTFNLCLSRHNIGIPRVSYKLKGFFVVINLIICIPLDEEDDVGMRSGFLSITEENDAWLCLWPPCSPMQSSIPL